MGLLKLIIYFKTFVVQWIYNCQCVINNSSILALIQRWSGSIILIVPSDHHDLECRNSIWFFSFNLHHLNYLLYCQPGMWCWMCLFGMHISFPPVKIVCVNIYFGRYVVSASGNPYLNMSDPSTKSVYVCHRKLCVHHILFIIFINTASCSVRLLISSSVFDHRIETLDNALWVCIVLVPQWADKAVFLLAVPQYFWP